MNQHHLCFAVGVLGLRQLKGREGWRGEGGRRGKGTGREGDPGREKMRMVKKGGFKGGSKSSRQKQEGA